VAIVRALLLKVYGHQFASSQPIATAHGGSAPAGQSYTPRRATLARHGGKPSENDISLQSGPPLACR
jgi:hypothetical protein